MNIAICDDNIYIGSKIEALVSKAFDGNIKKYNCEVFTSGDELVSYLEKNPLAFQIYLLDIEMDGINGLEAAAKIRQQDIEAVIIFMTSHGELMSEAFKVLAFQYIVKPFDEEKTMAILLSAIRYLESKKALYQYTVRKTSYTIPISQIEYIESIGRKVALHTSNGVKEYYGTLKEALEKVSGIRFSQIHNSYIINMEYVLAVESHSVTMKSQTQLTISAKYHNQFHNAYRKFILSKTGL